MTIQRLVRCIVLVGTAQLASAGSRGKQNSKRKNAVEQVAFTPATKGVGSTSKDIDSKLSILESRLGEIDYRIETTEEQFGRFNDLIDRVEKIDKLERAVSRISKDLAGAMRAIGMLVANAEKSRAVRKIGMLVADAEKSLDRSNGSSITDTVPSARSSPRTSYLESALAELPPSGSIPPPPPPPIPVGLFGGDAGRLTVNNVSSGIGSQGANPRNSYQSPPPPTNTRVTILDPLPTTRETLVERGKSSPSEKTAAQKSILAGLQESKLFKTRSGTI